VLDFVAQNFEIALSARLERKCHVVEHSEVGPDGVGLKNHADISLVRRNENPTRGIEDSSAAQLDLSFLRPLQSGHAAQSRGLAATGWAEESKKLSWLDVEADFVDGFDRAVAAHAEQFA